MKGQRGTFLLKSGDIIVRVWNLGAWGALGGRGWSGGSTAYKTLLSIPHGHGINTDAVRP